MSLNEGQKNWLRLKPPLPPGLKNLRETKGKTGKGKSLPRRNLIGPLYYHPSVFKEDLQTLIFIFIHLFWPH